MIGGRITSDYVTKGGASITGTNSLLYFIYDNSGLPIGFEVSNSTTYPTGVYTYQKNLQGDVIGVVDSDGNQVASYSYDAWGNIISQSGTLADINPIRYKGYYYDSDIGMYYLQSRYYDPALRRFINADDPSLIEELAKSSVIGSNLFGYCENNGVNRLDLSGKSALTDVLNAISIAINGIIKIVELIIQSAIKELKSFVNSVKLLSKKQLRHVNNLKALVKDASRLNRRLKIIAYAILFVSIVPMLIKAKNKSLALVGAFIDITVSFLAIGLSWIVSKAMKFFGVLGWIISTIVDTIGESIIRLYFTSKRIKKMAKNVYNAIKSKKPTKAKVFKALFSAMV